MWEGPKTASTKTEFHQNLAKIEIYFSYLSVNLPWNVFLCVLSSVLVNLNGPMPLATPYFLFRGAKNESWWKWRPLPAPINGVEPYSTHKYLRFWSVFIPQTPPLQILASNQVSTIKLNVLRGLYTFFGYFWILKGAVIYFL